MFQFQDRTPDEMKAVFALLILCALAWSSRSSEQTPVTDIDPCLSQPCENGGTCVYNRDTYRCDCAAGFVGTECHDVDCDNQQFLTEATDITSPFYPLQYPLYKRCSYSLESEPGELIQVKFSKFELETSHECKNDYISVFDGGDSLSPIIGKYCGNQTPETIVTAVPVSSLAFAPTVQSSPVVSISPQHQSMTMERPHRPEQTIQPKKMTRHEQEEAH
ncbi:bone morphogenetic protein 1-like [Ptychodera flava]|uniref:bone morphogenetic protein 1-like n=1 Tax=Ptychodera flava TaxID=63121 RepID=UPI00396AAFC5